ncbi:MAG TPA: hypothetical protein VJS42_13225 [Steroidobacteraceae bacterium]|nr:hypothetical protein [Steroidobacteraceae bacterium]
MGEQKIDEFSATGAHRAWVGEGAQRSSVRAGAEKREPSRGWLERSTPANPNPRHGAITRSLYSWSNYKSWTEKVRSDWKKEEKDKGK